MKKLKETVIYIFLVVYLIAMPAVSIYLRFSNPSMTQTEIAINFWPIWTVFLIPLIIFLFIFHIDSKRDRSKEDAERTKEIENIFFPFSDRNDDETE